MNRAAPLMLLAIVLQAGCASPALNANIGIGPGGVKVTPVVSTRVGGANISISP